VFRNLMLAEFSESSSQQDDFWKAHVIRGVIADPFMGGGTPVYEANRLGLHVIGTDINPMAYWIVRQSLMPLDLELFEREAARVVDDVDQDVNTLYQTQCLKCGETAKVKYFLWVKTDTCPSCEKDNDLFPGYLLAEDARHPKNVIVCADCGALNECATLPTLAKPAECHECGANIHKEGPAKRQRIRCRYCSTTYSYPSTNNQHPPVHRMFALEYHCEPCKPTHEGRFFKRPDAADLARFERAATLLAENSDLQIPDSPIPAGDESDRPRKWGYNYYREMFNERQLLGLGLLLKRILKVEDINTRHALLTVFSDFIRYQNMLCRYDVYALKCQCIFSIHGFPVGLTQCENNLLGIPRVGAGAFRHFLEKYLRAKRYCASPFETLNNNGKKKIVPIAGESIGAELVESFPTGDRRQAHIAAMPAVAMPLMPDSLDGVFTDPPYFDNVQYAELIDFCFAWLRLGLQHEFDAFRRPSTRSPEELTGNVTLGRGLDHFTEGISAVFRHYSAALKPGAPFVFTYHHNNPEAYVPLVVAILDAQMNCTVSLPVAAEMTASLHIAGTGSSVLDSVFVCRVGEGLAEVRPIDHLLIQDVQAMKEAGVKITLGDVRCLASGHVARVAVNRLYNNWDVGLPLAARMSRVRACLKQVSDEISLAALPERMLEATKQETPSEVLLEATV
jgi:adenine-specific DNA methylase